MPPAPALSSFSASVNQNGICCEWAVQDWERLPVFAAAVGENVDDLIPRGWKIRWLAKSVYDPVYLDMICEPVMNICEFLVPVYACVIDQSNLIVIRILLTKLVSGPQKP